MDLNKIFDCLEKNNIDQNKIFELVDEAKKMDLKNEDEIKSLIEKGATLAKRDISEERKSEMIKLIKEKGLTPELLDLL